MKSKRLTVVAAFTLALITACGGSQAVDEPWTAVDWLAALEHGEPLWLDPHLDAQIGAGEVNTRIRSSNVVIVGELHDQEAHHRLQAEVAQVLAQSGDEVVLALEMLTRPVQADADLYASGEMSREEFRETVWDEVWMDFELYEELIVLAESPEYSLLALNAPREIVSRVFDVGLDGLTEEERGQLAEEFFPPDPAYEEWLIEILRQHMPDAGTDPEMEAQFIQAQRSWDETMAETLATAVAAAGPETRFVVAAGNGHVEHGWGIPSGLARRVDTAMLTIVQLTLDPADPESAELLQEALDDEPADFVVVWAE